MSSSPNQLKNITSLTHIELIKQTTELMLKGNYQYLLAWQDITSYHNRLGWTNPDSGKIKNYLQAILNKYEPTEQQDKNTLVVCGMIYQVAEIGDANPFKKAMKIYKLAEARGSSQAINNIGLMYKQGLGVKQDYTKAKSYYEKAAKLGNAYAMKSLGFMYDEGQGVKQDYAKARSYYEKAAKLGNAGAMSNLGHMYRLGWCGVKQDYGKATSYYEEAAKLGKPEAMYFLGAMYKRGQGVKQDCGKAKSYFKHAVKFGYSSAMDWLGFMYNYGEGVKQDDAKAINHYEKAVKLGHPRSMKSLGDMYRHGQGVDKDSAKAARLYRLAVKKGISSGKFRLESEGIPVFLYHLAMMDNHIAKAAKVIIKNPELIKEVEAFDCKHLSDGVSSRESIASLITAISITEGFENNKGLGRAVERLKRYLEIPSLVKLMSTTIKEHNEDNPSSKIDYSFFSITLIEMTELPEIKTNTNSKASENDNHERLKL